MDDAPLPLIHMNGTPHARLLEGWEKAMEALTAARDALRAVEFNARDYAPQSAEAWHQAREAFTHHQTALAQAHTYSERHVIHLYDNQP